MFIKGSEELKTAPYQKKLIRVFHFERQTYGFLVEWIGSALFGSADEIDKLGRNSKLGGERGNNKAGC